MVYAKIITYSKSNDVGNQEVNFYELRCWVTTSYLFWWQVTCDEEYTNTHTYMYITQLIKNPYICFACLPGNINQLVRFSGESCRTAVHSRHAINIDRSINQNSDQATNSEGDSQQVTSTSFFYWRKWERNLSQDIKALFQV